MKDAPTPPGDGEHGAAGESRRLLGELLVDRGLISDMELEYALQEQREIGGRLGEVLVALDLVSLPELMAALTEQHGLGEEPKQSLRGRLRPVPKAEVGPAVAP